MIHVLATIHLNPGSREQFLQEFHRLVPLVRAEAGCIEYGPTVEVATTFAAQEILGESAVVVVEKWVSLDALQAHMKAPHMADYRLRVKDFVKGVQLRVLRPAE